ncbi:DNA-processing protein DprA [Limnoglobus roseus]|uniref:DNA recombination-mediator protein A n=1 Tax=Limnoglobus roseus TaxID=2598579 RepID=A0A5C1ANV7_9BACT|nr:DNA-processing protein DprA [Limnoglobus roseus]QEL19837.1 DNA recombination-mediator protein A [Limnoglobus roseus]
MRLQLDDVISPQCEMVSYETLCAMDQATTKRVSELFTSNPGLPSRVLNDLSERESHLSVLKQVVESYLRSLRGFYVSVAGSYQFPTKLCDARYPLRLFYYRGFLQLAETRCVSVVGARKATPEGKKRADRLARELVESGYTIVSGLAEGIDTAAMTAAMSISGGQTIGVIGTPITESYPKFNAALQEQVARQHLLISQVPFYRYAHQPFKTRRYYFPERNETMAAISEATVIVEASDTSGSLTQARAALQQGRKLFILNSCFENPNITWPKAYEAKGAVRIRRTEDILTALRGGHGSDEMAEI